MSDKPNEKKRCPINCLLMAGIGGMIPTLCKLASSFSVNPNQPLPEYGLYIGLSLFFIIGTVLAYAFQEENLKQAFILGICAPAIITSIVSGANEGKTPIAMERKVDAKNNSIKNKGTLFKLNNSAYASEELNEEGKLIIDFINRMPPVKMKMITIKKSLIVSILPKGKLEYNRKRFLRVVTLDNNNKILQQFYYPILKRKEAISLDPNGKSIQIEFSGRYARFDYPNEHTSEIEVSLGIDYIKSDFLWVLGNKRVNERIFFNAYRKK